MNMMPGSVPFNPMPTFDGYFSYSYPIPQMYPNANYNPDYSKSDTNSDESLNDGKDIHKSSPKYREKRAKNNEAAKKSRLNRKNREKQLQDENTQLKMRLAEQEKRIADLSRQLSEASSAAAVAAFRTEQQYYSEQMLTTCADARMTLRDTTNQQTIPTNHLQMHFGE